MGRKKNQSKKKQKNTPTPIQGKRQSMRLKTRTNKGIYYDKVKHLDDDEEIPASPVASNKSVTQNEAVASNQQTHEKSRQEEPMMMGPTEEDSLGVSGNAGVDTVEEDVTIIQIQDIPTTPYVLTVNTPKTTRGPNTVERQIKKRTIICQTSSSPANDVSTPEVPKQSLPLVEEEIIEAKHVGDQVNCVDIDTGLVLENNTVTQVEESLIEPVLVTDSNIVEVDFNLIISGEDEEINYNKHDINKCRETIVGLHDVIDAQQEKVRSMGEEMEKKDEVLCSLEIQLKKRVDVCKSLEVKESKLNSQMNNQKTEINKWEEKVKLMSEEIEKKEKEVTSLEAKLKKSETTEEMLNNHVRNLKSEIHSWKESFEQKKVDVGKLNEFCETQAEKVAEIELKSKHLNEENS